jgi:hypothetical protein
MPGAGVRCRVSAFQFSSFSGFYLCPPTATLTLRRSIQGNDGAECIPTACMRGAKIWISGKLKLYPIHSIKFLPCITTYFFFM